jgi:hypothetical protein
VAIEKVVVLCIRFEKKYSLAVIAKVHLVESLDGIVQDGIHKRLATKF